MRSLIGEGASMIKTLNMKWKRLLKLSLILFGVIGLQGCTVEGGCEYYYSFSTPSNYYCTDMSEDYLLVPPTDSEICFYGEGNTFHEGKSCSTLGYREASNVGDYQYNANKDPSPYGAYSSLGSSTGGGTGAGGSATPCDWNTVWTGDPNDVQVSTQCQAACVYADGGSEEGRAASCSIVAQWGATGSCSICP